MVCCRSKTCWCFDSRTGSALVSVVNLVVGSAGTVILYFVLMGLTGEMNQLQRTERPSAKTEQKLDELAELYWLIILSYVFPVVVTFLVGFFVVLGAVKNNEYLILISIFMSGILIFASFSIGVILFVLSFSVHFIIPLSVWGLVQFYFTFVLLGYRYEIVKKVSEFDHSIDYLGN